MSAAHSSRLRVLVLEDEWVARRYLCELIEASGIAEVVGAAAELEEANELLTDAAGASGIDVVFVDINLAGRDETGLSLVRAWARRDDAPAFVLATAVKDHAIEAFELGVVDYVLKPFVSERVSECLQRVRALRPSRGAGGPAQIVARRRRNLVFLPVAEVWAFESCERLTLVHSPRGAFDLDLSLNAIEGSFGHSFIRVHRNWLVSLAHIKELEREGGESVLLVGAAHDDGASGIRVPIARDRAQAVRDRLLASATGLRRR